MARAGLAFSCALVFCATVAAETPHSIESHLPQGTTTELRSLRVPDTVDRDSAKRDREDLYAWLMAEQVVEGTERPLVVELTSGEIFDIEQGRCEGCSMEPQRLLVGVVKEVSAEIAAATGAWGAAATTADGGMVWSAAVSSEGAAGIRLHFAGFHLPPNSELYLYNEFGDLAGPYEGDGPLGTGDFWSNMISGDSVVLQLRRYGPARSPGRTRQLPAVLVGVGHVGAQFASGTEETKSFCNYNARCIQNASCIEDPPEVDVARLAAAHMLFVDGPNLYACSGGLINNTNEDWTPYFMTANHCLSTDEVAATLETYFSWTVDCGEVCPTQWNKPIDAITVLGASVVSTGRAGDYSLLLLNTISAPLGTALLGWTSEPVAFSEGALLYRISHPAAAPQAYSEHQVETKASTCLFWPRGSWIYSRDVFGATEGGSSGSPVVDGEGRMVGQLTGSCGLFPRWVCLGGLHTTVDGAFAGYFDQVALWLDPPDGCPEDLDGDGYVSRDCGGDDCDDDDFAVNPGVAEECGNGIDDNCDLVVDDEDPDCAVCLPKGAACTKSADCCSKWCRWFGRTCR